MCSLLNLFSLANVNKKICAWLDCCQPKMDDCQKLEDLVKSIRGEKDAPKEISKIDLSSYDESFVYNMKPFPKIVEESDEFLPISVNLQQLDPECLRFHANIWDNNSCWMDSVLSIYYTVARTFFARYILGKKLTEIPESEKDDRVCDTTNKDNDLAIRKRLQIQLRDFWKRIQTNSAKCIDFGKMLDQCESLKGYYGTLDDPSNFNSQLLTIFQAFTAQYQVNEKDRIEKQIPVITLKDSIINQCSSFPEWIQKSLASQGNALLSLSYPLIFFDSSTYESSVSSLKPPPKLKLSEISVFASVISESSNVKRDGDDVILDLVGMVLFRNGHYISVLRCSRGWVLYDDLSIGKAVVTEVSPNFKGIWKWLQDNYCVVKIFAYAEIARNTPPMQDVVLITRQKGNVKEIEEALKLQVKHARFINKDLSEYQTVTTLPTIKHILLLNIYDDPDLLKNLPQVFLKATDNKLLFILKVNATFDPSVKSDAIYIPANFPVWNYEANRQVERFLTQIPIK